MKRIQRLGLLALTAAMLVTCAFGAGSAAASKFTAGKSGAALEVTTLAQHKFSITGTNVECGKVTFTGETEGTEFEHFTVTPSYAECKGFGFATVSVTPFNCTITWWIFWTTKHRKNPNQPCLTLVHSESAFGNCEVSVGEQSEVKSLEWSNGAASDLRVNFNVTGIKAEVTKSNGICPLTKGTHTNATYTGESTVKASGTTLVFDP
jgi:hypothetical protein